MLPPIFPKQHGMVDGRWTIKDKITQYKGLVKLSERDVKILQTDKRVTERKQTKEYRQLKKDIVQHREELSNAIKGDRQHHKNILSEHKFLQRTFQDHLPEKTLEYLEHKIFNKRKLLDRLHFKEEKKLKELTARKLTCTELQSNLIITNNKTNEQRMGEIVAGKLQETNIKLEAALQIKYIYKQILDILKKDKMNFDCVLGQLMRDACHQSKCIYQATQIGQLATEYTDDRKHELEELQRVVKRDMKSRLTQLHVAEMQVKELGDSLKLLVRKESTLKIDKVSNSVNLENQMQQDLQGLEKTLQDLQNVTYSDKFKDILPCFQHQQHKNKQMVSLLRKSVSEKQTLVNKIKHAESMYSHVTNTTVYSTFEYMEKKVKLKQSFEDTQTKLQKLKKALEEKSNIAIKMRSVLLHLQQLCRIISNPNKSKQPSTKFVVPIAQSVSDNKIMFAPEQSEMDAINIIADLEARLPILINADNQEQVENTIQTDVDAEKYFQKFISQISRKVPMEEERIYDALILEIEPKDPNVLTRECIKKESQMIVDKNAKPDWML